MMKIVFLARFIFRKKQRYVTLDDDKNITTSNKIVFEGEKNAWDTKA